MGMVWCMSADEAQRRLALADEGFARELQMAFGARNARIVRVLTLEGASRRHAAPSIELYRAPVTGHRASGT